MSVVARQVISFRLFTNEIAGKNVAIHPAMERPETRYLGAKSNIKSILPIPTMGERQMAT
jgi:hypothetical protein